MSFRSAKIAGTGPYLIAGLLGAAFILAIVGRPYVLVAQVRRPQTVAKNSDKATLVARGKYIVEGVAGCGYCHTPRDQDGNPDRSRWLEGWADTVPRLVGLPPESDAELIKLLTTAVARTGKPPRWPKPDFV